MTWSESLPLSPYSKRLLRSLYWCTEDGPIQIFCDGESEHGARYRVVSGGVKRLISIQALRLGTNLITNSLLHLRTPDEKTLELLPLQAYKVNPLPHQGRLQDALRSCRAYSPLFDELDGWSRSVPRAQAVERGVGINGSNALSDEARVTLRRWYNARDRFAFLVFRQFALKGGQHLSGVHLLPSGPTKPLPLVPEEVLFTLPDLTLRGLQGEILDPHTPGVLDQHTPQLITHLGTAPGSLSVAWRSVQEQFHTFDARHQHRPKQVVLAL